MIPDWTNLDAYPSVESTIMVQWCWEFLRRNEDFREAWNRYKITGTMPTRDFLFHTFGTIKLCDWQEDFGSPYVAMLCLREYAPLVIVSRYELLHMEHSELERATTPNMAQEVVIKFDVRNDIDSQLQQAREFLEITRKSLKPPDGRDFSPAQPDRSAATFPTYLQLLDAKDQLSPLSDAEVIRRVRPKLAPGEDEISAKEKLKKCLKRARYMRDTGYKTLSLEKYRLNLTDDEVRQLLALNNILKE